MPKKEEKKKAVAKKEKIVDDTPKRYYVDFYLKKEPIAKDEKVGTIFYSDEKKSIEIEGLVPNYSSEIEQLMLGDYMFMDGAKQVNVSRYEEIKEWVLNLYKANLNNFYASEVTTINETE